MGGTKPSCFNSFEDLTLVRITISGKYNASYR